MPRYRSLRYLIADHSNFAPHPQKARSKKPAKASPRPAHLFKPKTLFDFAKQVGGAGGADAAQVNLVAAGGKGLAGHQLVGEICRK